MKLLHLGLGMPNDLGARCAIASLLFVGILGTASSRVEARETPVRKAAAVETQRSTASIKLRDLKQPAKTIKEWLAQSENRPSTASVQVTGVKLERVEAGLDITLETADGKPLQVDATKFRAEGKSLIADIPNAVLALPKAQEFSADNPTGEIATVRVTQTDAATVRVSVIGTTALPKSDVTLKVGGLAYSLNAEGQTPEEELVVTGQGERGYFAPDATTATRTDTPLRDIPQSIQVVPQQVLKDQQVIQASEALRNVSGVQRSIPGGNTNDRYLIRGFDQTVNLRDGFRDTDTSLVEIANLERIEVLKGPASVLYGNVDPGGVINFVTKQPLRDPFYSFEVQAGSFGLVRPTVDLSGPLNSERTLRYRLNAVYQNGGEFRDFDQEVERFFVSPVLSWQIGDRTNLTLEFEHLHDERPFDRGLVAIGRKVADIPYDRVLGERDDKLTRTDNRVGYRLELGLNQDWTLRSRFRFSASDFRVLNASPGSLNEQTGILSRSWNDTPVDSKQYLLQNDLVGKFSIGSVKHTLLFGVDLYRSTFDGEFGIGSAPSINIFNPVYGTVPRPNRDQLTTFLPFRTDTNSLGIFLQDQVALTDNLKLLLGGRFDLVDQKSLAFSGSETQQQDDAFTPRIGIVYQPIQPISLYASFSRSFQPNSGTRADGSLLEPVRGTQYEVGIKGELFNSRLTTTLAAYEITKSNVATTDPNNLDFFIPVGEQRSRGIELDIAGEILPGWNIIASYAYTDAKVTQSNEGQEGNQLFNVPYNSASLWTTYEIQTGSLKGLGFGLGLFYVGEREGDLANSFETDSYLRTDASISYRRNNLRLGLNFKNLFNINYIEVSQTRALINSGTPFTVQGTISFTF